MRKILLYILLLSSSIFAQESIYKEGDLIFQNLNCGPMCEAINEVTLGYNNLNFNHMGMVFNKNNKWFVIEAGLPEVRIVPLEKFLTYTPNTMYLGRVKDDFQKIIPKAIAFAVKQIGTPYDSEFIYDNDKYYCSELIYDAFKEAYGKPFFNLYPMTYKPKDSEEFFPIWVEYYKKLGVKIPEGLPGCNPAGMSLSNKIDIIFAIKPL